jgi:hypothetical protein
MLIITLFTLAFCDGHVNDFYTEYRIKLIDWLIDCPNTGVPPGMHQTALNHAHKQI